MKGPNMLVKLTSRKLWLAVGTVVALVASKQYDQAVVVALAYLGVEGAADVAGRRSKGDA
jgi:hypothetical protein